MEAGFHVASRSLIGPLKSVESVPLALGESHVSLTFPNTISLMVSWENGATRKVHANSDASRSSERLETVGVRTFYEPDA